MGAVADAVIAWDRAIEETAVHALATQGIAAVPKPRY